MRPIILFRASLGEEGELEIAKRYFKVIQSRVDLKNDFVIPRYSALPYYEELEQDVDLMNGTLINSHTQHRYVANLSYWYNDLSDFTPKTFFQFYEADQANLYPYVLKGKTNSKKNLWKTHMLANNKDELGKVFNNLMDDSLIGDQGIVFRQFEKFKSYGEAVNGMPITKEFRVFMYKDQVLAKGFYWSNQPEVIERYKPDANEIPIDFINKIANIVKDKINFWVMDVAQREDNEWRVIELNDGSMSGLSCVNPDELYGNLKCLLKVK